MAEYITWADEAAAGDLVAPTTSKQHAGWVDGEKPPHEYFNWYQNRTDRRLDSLEEPVEMYESISDSETRPGTIAIRKSYTVPQYRVGSNQLQIYLDGILCVKGETYEEVGRSGAVSSSIEFLVAIPKEFQIIARAPIKIGESVKILVRDIAELEELVERTVQEAMDRKVG